MPDIPARLRAGDGDLESRSVEGHGEEVIVGRRLNSEEAQAGEGDAASEGTEGDGSAEGGGKTEDSMTAIPVSMSIHHRSTNTFETVEMEVYPDLAPLGAERFLKLLEVDFYDDACFFRVMKNFVAQVGIPAEPAMSEGFGEFNDDPVRTSNQRGWVSFAARGQANTRSYQIFFNYKDNSRLDALHFAPFAKVVSGMEALDHLYELRDGPTAPSQTQIQRLGNAYLLPKYPDISCIVQMRRGHSKAVSFAAATASSAGTALQNAGSGLLDLDVSAVLLFLWIVLVIVVGYFCHKRGKSWSFNRDLRA